MLCRLWLWLDFFALRSASIDPLRRYRNLQSCKVDMARAEELITTLVRLEGNQILAQNANKENPFSVYLTSVSGYGPLHCAFSTLSLPPSCLSLPLSLSFDERRY